MSTSFKITIPNPHLIGVQNDPVGLPSDSGVNFQSTITGTPFGISLPLVPDSPSEISSTPDSIWSPRSATVPYEVKEFLRRFPNIGHLEDLREILLNKEPEIQTFLADWRTNFLHVSEIRRPTDAEHSPVLGTGTCNTLVRHGLMDERRDERARNPKRVWTYQLTELGLQVCQHLATYEPERQLNEALTVSLPSMPERAAELAETPTPWPELSERDRAIARDFVERCDRPNLMHHLQKCLWKVEDPAKLVSMWRESPMTGGEIFPSESVSQWGSAFKKWELLAPRGLVERIRDQDTPAGKRNRWTYQLTELGAKVCQYLATSERIPFRNGEC